MVAKQSINNDEPTTIISSIKKEPSFLLNISSKVIMKELNES